MIIVRNISFIVKSSFLLLCSLTFVLLGSSASADDLNHDFELGTDQGWNFTGDGSLTLNEVVESVQTLQGGDSIEPNSGDFFFLFDMFGPSSSTVTKNLTNISTLSIDMLFANYGSFTEYVDGEDNGITGGNEMWVRLDLIKTSANSNSLSQDDIIQTLFDSNFEIGAAGANNLLWTTYSTNLDGAPSELVLRMITVNTNTYLSVALDNLRVTKKITSKPSSVTWAPSILRKGDKISEAHLNAYSATPGTFIYSSSVGDSVDGDYVVISASFLPNDPFEKKWGMQKVIFVEENK